MRRYRDGVASERFSLVVTTRQGRSVCVHLTHQALGRPTSGCETLSESGRSEPRIQ